MEKTLLIFGDSWADPAHGLTDDLRWWDHLRNNDDKINVEVVGRAGAAPGWVLEQLYKRISEGYDPANTYLIYLLGEPRVLQYPTLFDQHPHLARAFAFMHELDSSRKLLTSAKENKGFDLLSDPMFEHASRFLYQYYVPSIENCLKEFQYANHIKCLARRFTKTLVWLEYKTAWDAHGKTVNHGYTHAIIDDAKAQLDNTETFQWIDYPLNLIGTVHDPDYPKEYLENFTDAAKLFADKQRNNHLSAVMHERMANFIYLWLTNKGPIDIKLLTGQ